MNLHGILSFSIMLEIRSPRRCFLLDHRLVSLSFKASASASDEGFTLQSSWSSPAVLLFALGWYFPPLLLRLCVCSATYWLWPSGPHLRSGNWDQSTQFSHRRLKQKQKKIPLLTAGCCLCLGGPVGGVDQSGWRNQSDWCRQRYHTSTGLS